MVSSVTFSMIRSESCRVRPLVGADPDDAEWVKVCVRLVLPVALDWVYINVAFPVLACTSFLHYNLFF